MEDSLPEYLLHKSPNTVMPPSRTSRIIQVVRANKFLAQNNLLFPAGHTCTRKCAFVEQDMLHIRDVIPPF